MTRLLRTRTLACSLSIFSVLCLAPDATGQTGFWPTITGTAETGPDRIKFLLAPSAIQTAFDGIVVCAVTVHGDPNKSWSQFATKVYPAIKEYTDPNANGSWTNQMPNVSATAPYDAQQPYTIDPRIVEAAVTGIDYGNLAGFVRDLHGSMKWPNSGWNCPPGAMNWGGHAIAGSTDEFKLHDLVRACLVNQIQAIDGNTYGADSPQIDTIMEMIEERKADFSLNFALIELQDPPTTSGPAIIEISLSSTVGLQLAPSDPPNGDYFLCWKQSGSLPCCYPSLLADRILVDTGGPALPGQDPWFAFQLAGGGWTFVPALPSAEEPNGMECTVPADAISGDAGIIDMNTGMPMPIRVSDDTMGIAFILLLVPEPPQ